MNESSITLKELSDRFLQYINEHPNDANKMIYFDALHINGYINPLSNNILELF